MSISGMDSFSAVEPARRRAPRLAVTRVAAMSQGVWRAVLCLAILTAGGLSGPAVAGGISGTYVGSSPNGAFLIQVVQTNDGQLTGRYEQVLLQPSGKLEDTNAAITGAVDNGTVVVTIKPNEILSGSTTASGTFDGRALHLSGGGNGASFSLNLASADENAFHTQVAKLTEQADQIRAAQAEAEQQKQAAQAKAEQADKLTNALADLPLLSKQLASFGPYADKNYTRFEQIEQKYRAITADMRKGLAKQKAIVGAEFNADAKRFDIRGWINDAHSTASDLHNGVESADADFINKTKSILADTAKYDQVCGPIANSTPGNDAEIVTVLLWKSACADFQKGEASFHGRVGSLQKSFQHIAAVWDQENAKQQAIVQAANTAQ